MSEDEESEDRDCFTFAVDSKGLLPLEISTASVPTLVLLLSDNDDDERREDDENLLAESPFSCLLFGGGGEDMSH